ncbi:hypothetical protein RB201_00890 [Streptomyces sp. S1A(2023)]
MAKDSARLGFGADWAQATDQVCTPADGFLTVRGERWRFFGPDAAMDSSLSSAATNRSSDRDREGIGADMAAFGADHPFPRPRAGHLDVNPRCPHA